MNYAAREGENCGSTRLVRGLLVRGASPSIAADDGTKPIDFVMKYDDDKERAKFIDLLQNDDSDLARKSYGFCKRNDPCKHFEGFTIERPF